MRIVVTGANGFIGSKLSQELEKQGHIVKKVQRRIEKNVYVIKSLDKFTNWQEILKDVEVVIHCASITHESAKNKDPRVFRRVNIEAFQNLIDNSIQAKVKKIIYLSSIKAIGNRTTGNNFYDSNSLCKPSDLYGITKLEAENILKKSSLENGFDYVIIRPCLVYGPGVKANFLNLIKLIERKIPLPFKDINNLRSILFLDNLISFIIECIKNKNSSKKIFLLSDPYPLSTTALIKLIAQTLKVRVIFIKIPLFILITLSKLICKRDQVDRLLSSLVIDSFEGPRILDWEHPFTTKEGIKETIEWYKFQKLKTK